MIEQNPILITGCSRSGPSLVAGMVNLCGAFVGPVAKNSFENVFISEIEKQYFLSQSFDPEGQAPLPNRTNLPIPINWRQKIEQALEDEGYKTGPWLYKSPRACLIWPVWHYAFPNAKWVIVRRRSSDIAESCLKTSFMTAYNTYEEWIKWVNCYEDCYVEMIRAGVNAKVIWPERMVKGNYEQVYELIDWLGLLWKSEEVMKFMEPKLLKSRIKQGVRT